MVQYSTCALHCLCRMQCQVLDCCVLLLPETQQIGWCQIPKAGLLGRVSECVCVCVSLNAASMASISIGRLLCLVHPLEAILFSPLARSTVRLKNDSGVC